MLAGVSWGHEPRRGNELFYKIRCMNYPYKQTQYESLKSISNPCVNDYVVSPRRGSCPHETPASALFQLDYTMHFQSQ